MWIDADTLWMIAYVVFSVSSVTGLGLVGYYLWRVGTGRAK